MTYSAFFFKPELGRAAVEVSQLVFDLVLCLMGFVEHIFHKSLRNFSSPSEGLCSDSRKEEFLFPQLEMGYPGLEPLMMLGVEQNSSCRELRESGWEK